MIPDPLHPAIVHLPMALVVLLPLFTLGALFTISRGEKPSSSWRTVFILQMILSLSSWIAVETGEQDEDYYEHGPTEEVLEEHEELAEGFQIFTLAALPLAAAGFLAGRIGQLARFAYMAVTIALLVVGAMVGHRGGEIIYPDGAKITAEKLVGRSH
jgi:uncharacterized membrane protein